MREWLCSVQRTVSSKDPLSFHKRFLFSLTMAILQIWNYTICFYSSGLFLLVLLWFSHLLFIYLLDM